MPNGYNPNPHGLELRVTGLPNNPATWRTAALPNTHSSNEGYWITQADADRIVEIVKQQLDPLVGNAPAQPDPTKPPKSEQAGTATGGAGRPK